MKVLLIATLLLSSLLSLCCKKNPISPADITTPGRRDYLWTVDTIYTPFSMLSRIWGISPNDVWTISSGGDNDKRIFHFNGDSWLSVSDPIVYEPNSIFGFSSSDIWIGGGDGKIWHFDGNNWIENTTLNVVQGKGIVFEDIWGLNSDDIYAVGAFTDDSLLFNNGVIAHFDGTEWKILYTFNNSGNIARFYKTLDNQYPFVYIWHFDFYGDSTFIYQLKRAILHPFLAGSFGINSFLSMVLLNNHIYILKGKEIFVYENDNLKSILRVDLPNFEQGFTGRNDKDIFLIMNDGIAHYNGSNIEYIYRYNNIMIVGSIVFDKQVFFIGSDRTQGGRNLIITGKLAEN